MNHTDGHERGRAAVGAIGRVKWSQPAGHRRTGWKFLRAATLFGLVAALLLSARGGSALAQERYRIQTGDTIESIAATFSVDPQAILAASWVPDPDNLQPGQVIIIPNPGQTPAEAAHDAAAHEGQSPWVSTIYIIKAGDTIEDIAFKFGVTKQEIADLNGLSNPNMLDIGQKLLIPPADSSGSDTSETSNVSTPAEAKVQVVNLSCPTTGATSTQWQIFDPPIHQVPAKAQIKCEPVSGASFTFTGGRLDPGGLTVTTDASGTWKGTLPADSYTITDNESKSTNRITVGSAGVDVAVAVAVEHIHQSQVGTLDVKNYSCPAAADSVQIRVSQPGGATGTTPGTNCTPADASFQLDTGNPFSVGSEGEISLSTVPEGNYSFKDVTSGQTASVDIATGETTSIVVLHMTADNTGQTDASQSATTGSATVTQLPNTGAAPLGGRGTGPIGLTIALLALSGTAVVVRRRHHAA